LVHVWLKANVDGPVNETVLRQSQPATRKDPDMLPFVSNLKTSLIAGSVAVALLANTAAPAMAWGQREQDFTKGALAVLLLGAIVRDGNNHHDRGNHRPPVYQYPDYQPPVYQPPVYQPPVYQPPVYQQPSYYEPAPQPYYPPVQSVYSTPAAQAFQSYDLNERRRIQSTLANYGYYHGAIDGSFGSGTYQAITAYATRSGKMSMLETRAGAYGLMDGLLF
jgi:hypothetical protein